MTAHEAELLTILGIGREASMRGSGISLHQSLQQSRYADLRPSFDAEDLVPLIRSHPCFVEDWVAFSEDKRTDGGWYLLRDGSVGRLSPAVVMHLASIEQAVAEYVVRELDFWSGV